MSSDVANGKKKGKKAANNVGNSSSSEIISSSMTASKSQTCRIGPRVFKCVILGDGGVGKSGMSRILKQRKFCHRKFCHKIFCKTNIEKKNHSMSQIHIKYYLSPKLEIDLSVFKHRPTQKSSGLSVEPMT